MLRYLLQQAGKGFPSFVAVDTVAVVVLVLDVGGSAAVVAAAKQTNEETEHEPAGRRKASAEPVVQIPDAPKRQPEDGQPEAVRNRNAGVGAEHEGHEPAEREYKAAFMALSLVCPHPRI